MPSLVNQGIRDHDLQYLTNLKYFRYEHWGTPFTNRVSAKPCYIYSSKKYGDTRSVFYNLKALIANKRWMLYNSSAFILWIWQALGADHEIWSTIKLFFKVIGVNCSSVVCVTTSFLTHSAHLDSLMSADMIVRLQLVSVNRRRMVLTDTPTKDIPDKINARTG